ncbi:MAG: 30S ribosomal protein S12 methylthiotransferase RimO [Thermodesulfobacteriota bacterium]
MKVSLISLGCSKNLVDSELMLGSLKEAGHSITTENNADVIVVNTCGFISDATKESVNTIVDLLEYKRKGRCKKFIVTGCLVERYAEELKKELPEVDAFWGTGNIRAIADILDPAVVNRGYSSPPGSIYDPDSPRVLTTMPHMAYVKVSEGCSRVCSFCIIPRLRGGMKSREVVSIAAEARNLASRGIKELNLIAQDMTSYGRDIGTNLEALLRELRAVDGIEWLRLHYCYPWGFTDSLLELMAKEEKILSYIDLPLQHINDRLLKAMQRGTTTTQIMSLIEKLRGALDDLTLRTTFIVGFPGETEEEFGELLDFAEETRFQRLGAFKYSHEEGTRAGELDDSVTDEEKEERYERLMELQADISTAHNEALIGSRHDAFIEGTEDGSYIARIPSQAPEVDGYTFVKANRELRTGDMVRVQITGADTYDLFAELA